MNASSKPLLPTVKFSQFKKPNKIWVESMDKSTNLRRCLVSLLWLVASFKTKGEIIKTAARIIE